MKSWSKNWKSSKRRSKQRKYHLNAPKHVKAKFLGTNLSKELRKKYNRRNVKLRVGDKVKVTRGEFKLKVGKVKKIDIQKSKVEIDGVERKNIRGTKYNAKIDPSKIMILELNLEDKKRIKGV